MGAIKAVGRILGGFTENSFVEIVKKIMTNPVQSCKLYTKVTAGKYRIILKGMPTISAITTALKYVKKYMGWFDLKEIKKISNNRITIRISVSVENRYKSTVIEFFSVFFTIMFKETFNKDVSLVFINQGKNEYVVDCKWK